MQIPPGASLFQPRRNVYAVAEDVLLFGNAKGEGRPSTRERLPEAL